jgi:hypothetical protein
MPGLCVHKTNITKQEQMNRVEQRRERQWGDRTYWSLFSWDQNICSSTRYSVAAQGLENRDYGRGDPLRWPRDTLYQLKLALTSSARCGRSVGIVRLRTKTAEFLPDFQIIFFMHIYQ